MKERLIVTFLALVFIASIVVGVMVTLSAPRLDRPGALVRGRDGYAVVRLYGRIRSADEITIFGENGTDKVAARLSGLSRNPRVKAVVLRVNSPGGTVAATQEIHREVAKLKEKGIPVVVSISDLGASGGYYVSCGATKIFADKGSVVGSIGVISIFPNVQELLEDRLGVTATVITSGRWKDAGSPLRQMTPEELERFQDQANAVYDQFFEAVKQARLPAVEERLRQEAAEQGVAAGDLRGRALQHLDDLAQGQIFVGQAALEQGLIDQIGNFQDAVAEAKKLGGLRADAPRIGARLSVNAILEALAANKPGGAAAMADKLTTVRIEYLYLPGGILK